MTVFVSDGIAATYEINWSDPMAVGCQVSKPHDGPWCHTCGTGNHWSRLPFLGLVWLYLDVCWWCCGPMRADKPVHFGQRIDPTVANTNLEPLRPDDRNDWEAAVAGELARIYGERVA